MQSYSNTKQKNDMRHMDIAKAKGIDTKYTLEAHQLGIYSVMDALLFFPNNAHFKKINTYVSGHHFTHKQKLHFKDGAIVSADIYRTSKVIPQKCSNGALRLSFHCVPAEDKAVNKTNKQLFHDKRGFWIDTFRLDKKKDIIQNNNFFKVNGLYTKKWNSITISGGDKYHQKSGAIVPYYGKLVTAIGKYSQKTGVPEKDIQHLMLRVVPEYANQATEFVPSNIRQEHHFLSRGNAIFNCHFPDNDKIHDLAIESEKFEELYQYALKLAKLHQKRSRRKGFAIHYNRHILSKFYYSLPYRLTHDQAQCTGDITYDLKSPYKMARLLQGDVGSGKTVVAAFAILATISAGYQAALMVPTSPLATQHYKTFQKMFSDLNIHICLLTGKTSSHDKRVISKELKTGQIQLAIGTETLYQKRYHYRNLGLAVIDEQHRFGVRQRRTLAQKSRGCNVLSMTATPIPRTLATALYHAMDVSQIREMPKGRKPVITKCLKPKPTLYADLAELIKHQALKGGQTFVIAKLVKPSKQFKNQLDADTVFKHLAPLVQQNGNRIRLLHGQMTNDKKDALLNDFTNHKFDALVATSVVEVGVDVPNATQIIILNAEAYGLAQLHQLRGRVGRNSIQSYCYLISKLATKQARARLKTMEKTTNGFKVAEADLKLRGGGNLFGRAQSGLPDFPLASLSNNDDVQLLQMAQQDAQRQMR